MMNELRALPEIPVDHARLAPIGPATDPCGEDWTFSVGQRRIQAPVIAMLPPGNQAVAAARALQQTIGVLLVPQAPSWQEQARLVREIKQGLFAAPAALAVAVATAAESLITSAKELAQAGAEILVVWTAAAAELAADCIGQIKCFYPRMDVLAGPVATPAAAAALISAGADGVIPDCRSLRLLGACAAAAHRRGASAIAALPAPEALSSQRVLLALALGFDAVLISANAAAGLTGIAQETVGSAGLPARLARQAGDLGYQSLAHVRRAAMFTDGSQPNCR